MADIKSLLEQNSKSWQETKTRNQGDVIPGDYLFEIGLPKSGATISEDKDGYIRARLVLKVVGGEDETQVGKFTSVSFNLFDATGNTDDMGLSILKTTIERIGYDSGELEMSELPAFIEGLEGAVVQGTVKPSKTGEYMNTYINSMHIAPEDL